MNIAVSTEHQRITDQIDEANHRLERLKQELSLVNADLEKFAAQISIHNHLADISQQLEQLHELGAAELFWEDRYENENDFLEHISGLRSKSKTFNDQIDVVRKKKSQLEKHIENVIYDIAYLNEDLQIQKEREEESKHEYVVNREIEEIPYRQAVMPWSTKGEDEKRFRKYVLLAFLYSILLGVLIPFLKLPVPDKEKEAEIPERLAILIKEKKPKPVPKKEQKLAKKKKPSEEEKIKARKKVQNTGLLAFKNNFADLMDDVNEAKLGSNAKLSKQGSRAKSTSRSLVLAQAQSGSGGINTSSLSRDVGGAGGKIGSVKFSRVTSAIGTAAADDRPLSSGPGPSRTDEEIQIVFDRYKAALYRIYNRELRKNPTLQGKMVLRITILPNGKVSFSKVESTDLDSELLSLKIVERVKRFNFGAKAGVPKVTILYPIDFLPAS